MSAGSAVPGSSKDCSQLIKSNSSSKNSSKNNSTVPHLVQQQQQNNKDPQPGTSNHSSGNCNNSESAKSESAKGQLVSKCLFRDIILTKIATKIL